MERYALSLATLTLNNIVYSQTLVEASDKGFADACHLLINRVAGKSYASHSLTYQRNNGITSLFATLAIKLITLRNSLLRIISASHHEAVLLEGFLSKFDHYTIIRCVLGIDIHSTRVILLKFTALVHIQAGMSIITDLSVFHIWEMCYYSVQELIESIEGILFHLRKTK